MELAVVRLSAYTEASMKLTRGAIIVAPKKKTHHRSKYTRYLTMMKGMGKQEMQAKNPNKQAKAYAFGEL